MVIDIRLVLELVSYGGNQTTINAQAILTNKRVILRTDYNVPIQNGIIQSTKRMRI